MIALHSLMEIEKSTASTMNGEPGGYQAIDFTPVAKILFKRIRDLEPELVSKIIGYILLKDSGDRQMYQIAFARENVLTSIIEEAKTVIAKLNPLKLFPRARDSFPTAESFDCQNPVYEGYEFPEQQQQLMGMAMTRTEFGTGENYISNNYQQEVITSSDITRNSGGRTFNFPDPTAKPCFYHHTKGYCKHGHNCRYIHDGVVPECFNEGHVPLPLTNSLERLELEFIDILRSKRGKEISIATLPILYFEKYGRQIQAEGYLTESQRHGKPGSNLTKLLMKLKNGIRLINRPHGQHEVVLTEEMQRYFKEYYRNEQSSTKAHELSSSQQIYLTFPAESTFHEDDVANYFRNYGPVQNVRIPPQEKRMFGFVCFEYAETVRVVLGKGNPHYVCGHRVLVKPYKEKSKLSEKKQRDYSAVIPFNSSPYSEMKSGYDFCPIYSSPRSCQTPFSNQFQTTPGHDLLERLSHLNLASSATQPTMNPDFNYWCEDWNIPKEDVEMPPSTNHQPEILASTAMIGYNPLYEDEKTDENDGYNTELKSERKEN